MFSSYILSLGLGLQFLEMGLIMTINSNCWEDYPSSENLTVYHTSLRVCVCMHMVTQLYRTLCIPMNCSLPGSSVQGIFQSRILEWAAILYSRKWSRNLPNLRIKPEALASPAPAGGFFATVPHCLLRMYAQKQKYCVYSLAQLSLPRSRRFLAFLNFNKYDWAGIDEELKRWFYHNFV